MAEKLCCDSNTISSSEEIIEEVMKGVEDCFIKKPEEDAINAEKEAINIEKVTESHFNDPPKPDLNVNLSTDHVHSESLNTDNVKDTDSSIDDEFVDEDALKDAEESYTDEEKEQRRSEAESYKTKGNDNFKMGVYRESIKLYTLGLRTCPLAFPKERAIIYSNRAAARMKLELKESAIEDCTKAVELDSSYLKARYRRAQLYEETDKLDEALVDYQEILKLDPLHREALYATKRLPERILERNEKMKTEMFAKLKDLGNMILRPFNLSTDNFQVNQDPNTGGYSINFKSNSSQ